MLKRTRANSHSPKLPARSARAVTGYARLTRAITLTKAARRSRRPPHRRKHAELENGHPNAPQEERLDLPFRGHAERARRGVEGRAIGGGPQRRPRLFLLFQDEKIHTSTKN